MKLFEDLIDETFRSKDLIDETFRSKFLIDCKIRSIFSIDSIYFDENLATCDFLPRKRAIEDRFTCEYCCDKGIHVCKFVTVIVFSGGRLIMSEPL